MRAMSQSNGWMMRWRPFHGGYKPGFPGSMLPPVVLRGGLGWGCIVFRELRVSAVWILQTVAEGINRLSVSSTPPHAFSSGMGLFTEAVLRLMFVCVMRLFIRSANKCIINKPLPRFPLSVFSVYIRVFLFKCKWDWGHCRTLIANQT